MLPTTHNNKHAGVNCANMAGDMQCGRTELPAGARRCGEEPPPLRGLLRGVENIAASTRTGEKAVKLQ